MATRVQATTQSEVIRHFRFDDDAHRPSWKNYGAGSSSLHLQTHDHRRYLSITATESASDTQTTKRVMLTIPENDAAALYAWMKEHFEGKATK